MGCQRAVARKIFERRADYVLALTGNQGTLLDDVEIYVAEHKFNGFSVSTVSRSTKVDGDNVTWLRDGEVALSGEIRAGNPEASDPPRPAAYRIAAPRARAADGC